MNRYTARVSGEAFDADQIEHDDDDGYPTDFALWSRIEAGNRAARIQREIDEAMSLAPVVRVLGGGVMA